ncbi:alpha/beta hydrolase [Actinoplanes sp. NPDC051494]|uniref:alpha/beta hydrolase n=1 Tax=Actinoplanes sp. NPDC051494 TaxID=3363907 RepID=UPI00379940C5
MRVLASVLAGLLAGITLVTPASASPHQRCTDHTVDVRLSDPGPAVHHLWGRLCWRGTTPPATVQLLVPGGTYDHHYWDLSPRYSYVAAATSAGFATFSVDRVGSGTSSHPPSGIMSNHAEAVALHDVVTALRSGTLGRFRSVIWVGHSLGSIIGAFEISRYHDVDAFIATGMLHEINTDYFAETAGSVQPANQDPAFAGLGLDDGYTTTRPGVRSQFYAPGTVTPGVLAAEERTKSFQPALDFAEVAALLTPAAPELSATRDIGVPVLVVGGQDDRTYCGPGFADCTNSATVLAHEAPYYQHVRVVVVPRTGHSLGLSTTAGYTYRKMLAWSRAPR